MLCFYHVYKGKIKDIIISDSLIFENHEFLRFFFIIINKRSLFC